MSAQALRPPCLLEPHARKHARTQLAAIHALFYSRPAFACGICMRCVIQLAHSV